MTMHPAGTALRLKQNEGDETGDGEVEEQGAEGVAELVEVAGAVDEDEAQVVVQDQWMRTDW